MAEVLETQPDFCQEPGCVLLRVNTGRGKPVDTVGVHIHPGKSDSLPSLLGAAVAKVLQDDRLNA